MRGFTQRLSEVPYRDRNAGVAVEFLVPFYGKFWELFIFYNLEGEITCLAN
jgi:hypothetical protein